MYFHSIFSLTIFERYLLKQFLRVFIVAIIATTSLFLIIDLFERMKILVREGASVTDAILYLLYKLPLVIQLMIPVSTIVATILAVGRLSQSQELTAIRSCGAGISYILKPLLLAGLMLTAVMFLLQELITPIASQRVEEIWNIDIRKKDQEGQLNRPNFWFHTKNRFAEVRLFDSRSSSLHDVTVFEFDELFNLRRRLDSPLVHWNGHPQVTWTMKRVREIDFRDDGSFTETRYPQLPLTIDERPSEFVNVRIRPETMSFNDLRSRIKRLERDGAPLTKSLVDLNAKLAFPFVTVVVILIGFPFALLPARSDSLAQSVMAGVSIGFGYYILHAFSLALGVGEFLHPAVAAWTANIIFGFIGLFMVAGADSR